MLNGITKKRPELMNEIENVALHQDNAPPHTGNTTQLEIDVLGFQRVDHSSDLTKYFPEQNNHLQGTRFHSRDEMGLDARNLSSGVCEHAQADQRLCYSLFGKYYMLICYWWNFNFLASLCSLGDWFETRFVRIPKDRSSRDKAQIMNVILSINERHSNT